MSKNRNKAGYKKPPKHSQFKKGRSGNPNGRPRKYDPTAERKQLKALLALLEAQPKRHIKSKGNPTSLSYILWLLKELEIQIRLHAYDRAVDAHTPKKDEL